MEKKKTRVKSYQPKVDDADFKLDCEWGSCNHTSNSMDAFLDHVDNHINDYLFSCNLFVANKNNTTQKAADCTNSSELILDLDCKWRDCDPGSTESANEHKFDSISTYERHVRFHAFHTKLKFFGLCVINKFNENNNIKAKSCSLDSQSRNLIPELPYKFECSWHKCEYNTDNPELFYRHIKTHHSDYTKELKRCQWNDCSHEIKNRDRLVEHLRSHTQEKQVSCYVCGALFSTYTKYLDHCNRMPTLPLSSGRAAESASKLPKQPTIQFQCSHCNKKFLSNNLLKEHIRKHINRFKCAQCDMTCVDRHDLNMHVLYKHTSEKAFKCEYCEHASKTRADLNKHVAAKHGDENDSEYQCNECDHVSRDLNNIKRHMLKCHLNAAKFSYMYKCHVCEKLYAQGGTLSMHLKTVHKYQWPSGHSRFRYKLDNDGFYRLQTLRYESVELVEKITREQQEKHFQEQELQLNQGQFQMAADGFDYVQMDFDDRNADFDDQDLNEIDVYGQYHAVVNLDTGETHVQAVSGDHATIFDDASDAKDYLIQRLIDDENRILQAPQE